MEIKKWQSGLKLSVDNAIQLRDDGELLMERGALHLYSFSLFLSINF